MENIFRKYEMLETNVDYLTGLCNRRGQREVWEYLPEDSTVHCIYIDVDNFKLVNDTYGHAKGDALLIYIGNLLKDVFTGQLVTRMGGDEFTVLCNGTQDAADIEDKLTYLQAAIKSGKFDPNVEKLLSFSVGVTFYQKVAAGLQIILEQSDVAMYHVKKHGKGRYIVYDEIRNRIEEERAIKERALSNMAQPEIEILYRPVIYVQTSDVIGIEAVLQWNFPGRGIIPEEKFMPIFRQYGIDAQMNAYLLEEICKQKDRWRDTELYKLEFYVRMSARYLLQENSIASILQCIERYRLPLEEVKLCIDAKEFRDNEEKLFGVVQTLIDAGCYVAINDFATASSLTILRRIQARILKLDARLLEEAEENSKVACILRNVISLGRDLHYGIVAQGVENERQIKMLAGYGAQFGTGDFYGGACDVETFREKYQDRLFHVRNKQPEVFAFKGNLEDQNQKYEGTFIGSGLEYTTGVFKGQGALAFPGGGVKENVLVLPKEVMYSDSYSICFWIYPDNDQPWTSIVYITYKDGFMSLMPTSGHGDFFFRIKDDREANEWHDIMCRKAVPGQWAFICVTYDVITHIGKMYFNGLMVGSRENMPNLKIVEQITIGGDEYQNSYEGKLAGLEIHHYVLSAEQIEEKFRSYQQEPSFLGTDGRK
ncbi:MAG: EAL domain-containing protein [Lachnospiraceae bacterium]|nr:EAL domain-containing protein [Lachnospiraceae bacterium]